MPADRDIYEDVFVGADDEPPNRPRTEDRRAAERLRPLPGAFVRVPIQWLSKPCREHIAPAETRLFLYVLYRSHWGQRGVAVTDQVAAEVGVAPRTKRKHLTQLERAGWVRIERHTRHGAAIVWPIVVSG